MPSHPPAQPAADVFEGDERSAYERVVRRQRAYGYEEFCKNFPEADQPAVHAALLEAVSDEAGEDQVQPYMGAMLNSPRVMDLVSELGVILRNGGARPDSFAHADREWVDMVLSEELACWGVQYLHVPDALAVGVRLQAVQALHEGRDEDLTTDELMKARFIRQVARGTVTSESYRAIEEKLGRRGAVEYTQVVGWLLMTMRLIQAFGAQGSFTPAMVTGLLDAIESGEVGLPDPGARVSAAHPRG